MSAILQAFKDPDLRKKILITLALMILYRIGAQIPTPGVDYALINSRLEEVAQGDNATMFSIIGLFSGGALLQLSIFAIGIMPYITASIIVQLLTVVIPKFEELKKETSLKNIKDYNDKSFHQAVLSIGPAPFDIVDKYLPAYYEYIE